MGAIIEADLENRKPLPTLNFPRTTNSRFITCIVIFAQTAIDELSADCLNRIFLLCYSGAAAAVLIFLLIVEIRIAKISTLGTVADDSPRINIGAWMDVHLALIIVDLVTTSPSPQSFHSINSAILLLRCCIRLEFG